MTKPLLIAGCLFLFAACSGGELTDAEKRAIDERAEQATEEALSKAKSESMQSQFAWSYETTEDEATGGTTDIATLTSPTEIVSNLLMTAALISV